MNDNTLFTGSTVIGNSSSITAKLTVLAIIKLVFIWLNYYRSKVGKRKTKSACKRALNEDGRHMRLIPHTYSPIQFFLLFYTENLKFWKRIHPVFSSNDTHHLTPSTLLTFHLFFKNFLQPIKPLENRRRKKRKKNKK